MGVSTKGIGGMEKENTKPAWGSQEEATLMRSKEH
jgi:hypothetical protein